jgi:thiamine biosynthesis lipoprotein
MAQIRDRSTPFPSRLRLSLGLNGFLGTAPVAVVAVVAVLAGIGALRRADSFRVVRARYAMGTILEIEAFGDGRSATEAGVAAAFRTVDEVETRLSNWRANSEMSLANAAADRPFSLSPATWGVLSRAFVLANETDGAFDPTVGAVTRGLRGNGGEPDTLRPNPDAVGWRKVRLDPRARSFSFVVPGGAIDTGGFTKGEALDRALVALRAHGIEAARLNFGGQISLFGTSRPAGRRNDLGAVSIAEPRATWERELCRFSTGDRSVSTSSQSERPGHIVDPRTGTAVLFAGSVTVIADTGLRADALSTALFVLGPTAGIAFADRRGIAAVYVIPHDGGWQLLPSRMFPPLQEVR